MRGPLTAGEVEERLGPCWVPIRRFPVKQRKTREEECEAGTPQAMEALSAVSLGEDDEFKLRMVDDASEFLQNSTASRPEKADLDGLDGYLNIIKMFRGAVGDDRRVCIRQRSGKTLRGILHRG